MTYYHSSLIVTVLHAVLNDSIGGKTSPDLKGWSYANHSKFPAVGLRFMAAPQP